MFLWMAMMASTSFDLHVNLHTHHTGKAQHLTTTNPTLTKENLAIGKQKQILICPLMLKFPGIFKYSTLSQNWNILRKV